MSPKRRQRPHHKETSEQLNNLEQWHTNSDVSDKSGKKQAHSQSKDFTASYSYKSYKQIVYYFTHFFTHYWIHWVMKNIFINCKRLILRSLKKQCYQCCTYNPLSNEHTRCIIIIIEITFFLDEIQRATYWCIIFYTMQSTIRHALSTSLENNLYELKL